LRERKKAGKSERKKRKLTRFEPKVQNLSSVVFAKRGGSEKGGKSRKTGIRQGGMPSPALIWDDRNGPRPEASCVAPNLGENGMGGSSFSQRSTPNSAAEKTRKGLSRKIGRKGWEAYRRRRSLC